MSLASLGLGPYLTTGIVFQPLVLQAKNFGFTKFEEWRESGNVVRPMNPVNIAVGTRIAVRHVKRGVCVVLDTARQI